MTLLVYLALAGCSAFAEPAPAALPTVVLDENPPASPAVPLVPGNGVIASGVVVPAQESRLVFTLAGKVRSVVVSAGDEVEAGQTLVELEGQENLEVAVGAARLELEQSRQALEDLDSAAEQARIQAMKDIITFEQAVRDARYTLDNFTVPSNQAGLDTVEALNRMKQRLDEARQAFEPYKYRPSNDPTRVDLKEALDEAQADYNAAVRRLQYEYDLEVAEAQLAQALGDYEVLKQGPDPDLVRLANARLENARIQLAAAEAALGQLTLTAPFSGTVGEVFIHRGEWVLMGQPVLVLADLERLRVQTTDLSERDLPRIGIGQAVVVFVKALNLSLAGRVSAVSPLADTLGGDVVYQTTIDLDELPADLHAGMSVDVQFGTGP